MYKVMTIKTAYSVERFLYEYDEKKRTPLGDPADEYYQAEDFLAEWCYCDAYEVTAVRDATAEETAVMERLLDEGKDFWAAQTKVCYPNEDSVNELIYKYAQTPKESVTVPGTPDGTLVGFIHQFAGEDDFQIWNVQLSDEDRTVIQTILDKYRGCGVSVRGASRRT